MIGDGHQPNSRGVYTHYKDFVIKGWMTIPNTRSLDAGTCVDPIIFKLAAVKRASKEERFLKELFEAFSLALSWLCDYLEDHPT